jgi:hypothetical protein
VRIRLPRTADHRHTARLPQLRSTRRGSRGDASAARQAASHAASKSRIVRSKRDPPDSRPPARSAPAVTASDQLQYRQVVRSLRPSRAVTLFCSAGDWRADVLRIMEGYSRTWGGDGNGLAAVSATGALADGFWPLLTAFDADQWAVFHRTRRGLRMSDPQAYEAVLETDIAKWIELNEGSARSAAVQYFESDPVLSDVGVDLPGRAALDERIRRRLAPMASEQVAIRGAFRADEPPPYPLVDMCEVTYRPTRVCTLDLSRWPLSLQILVAGRVGGVAPAHRTYLEAIGTEIPSIPLTDDDLPLLLEYAWTGEIDALYRHATSALTAGYGALAPGAIRDFRLDTPLTQARLGCGWFRKWRPGLDDEPIVVMCGDSADDFAYALTRQRVVGDTYWFPAEPGDSGESFTESLRETLAYVLYSRYARRPSGNRKILVASLTLTRAQLQTLIAELSSTTWGRQFSPSGGDRLTLEVCDVKQLSTPRDWVLRDEAHVATAIHEPFLGTDMARSLEVPLPSEARGQQAMSCRWQVDVLRPDHVLPARWCLHSILSAGDTASSWAVRSSTAGISVDSHGRIFVMGGLPLSQTLVQVSLRYPSAAEVFASLLAGVHGSIEESDKGRYTRRMIQLWGDLKALATDLRGTPTRTLLAAWASNHIEGSAGRIHHERKYLRLVDVMQLSNLHVHDARRLLDRYIHRGIVARGLELRCDRCADTSFYRVEDFGEKFRCQRCRQKNLIVKSSWRELQEPQWFYALDEVVFHALNSNVHVPLLALDELAKPPVQSFLYMPEAVVRIPNRDQLEVDLWAIVDGEIVIGEAKKPDKLEVAKQAEIARCRALRALIEDLTADRFVMATASAEWNSRTRGNVDRLIGPSAEVHWLTNVGA